MHRAPESHPRAYPGTRIAFINIGHRLRPTRRRSSAGSVRPVARATQTDIYVMELQLDHAELPLLSQS